MNKELIKNSSIVIGRILTKEEFVDTCRLLEEHVRETSRYLKADTLENIARDFKEFYARDNVDVFIAIDKNNDNRVVGFVSGERTKFRYKKDEVYHVEDVYVTHDYRGSSAMVFLMRAIFKVASKANLYAIVNVFPQNRGSRELPTLAKRYADSDLADYVTFYRSPRKK